MEFFINHKINLAQNVYFFSYTLMKVKNKMFITKLQTMDKNYFAGDIHSTTDVKN